MSAGAGAAALERRMAISPLSVVDEMAPSLERYVAPAANSSVAVEGLDEQTAF